MVSKSELLSNYLANLKIDIFAVNYNYCAPDWRDLDYTPDYSKFYFICDGEGWLKINDAEYYPKPGQLFIMPEGIKQSYSYISSKPFLKYWCHFSAKVMDISIFKLIDCKPYINVPDMAFLENIFKEMNFNFNNNHIVSKLLSKARLMDAISYFIMNAGIDNINLINTSHVEKFNIILEYIGAHLYEELTIHELAKVIYMQPNYFIDFFKKNTGIPPIHYINGKRIEKARELLSTTSCTISEISELVGFSDTFYFSKLFKKYVGLSPKEYRILSMIENLFYCLVFAYGRPAFNFLL